MKTKQSSKMKRMTAKQVLEALRIHHKPRESWRHVEWAFFDEQRIGTGYMKDSMQRLDAWAIHYYPSMR